MKRKIGFLILAFCFLPWLQANATIVTSAGSGTICPGDEVVIPVTVSNCDGVAAISLALNFDASKVSYEGYQNLNTAISSMLVNQANGTVYFSWASISPVSLGNATLLELRFTGLTGSTGLNWNTTLCEYSDATGTIIQSTYSNGSVSIYSVPSLNSSPSDRNLVAGQSTTFDVSASGSGLSYQWQVKPQSSPEWENLSNGGHYSGVNGWRLYVNNVDLEMDGHQYRCVVSGTCPSPVTSEAATLHVDVFIPTIVTSTGSASSCPDIAFSIPVSVTNCNNVGSISLVLSYNSSLVTYIGYEDANALLSGGVMRVNAAVGKVYFTWASSNQSLELGNGNLISFVFKSASGNSSLSWDVAQCEYATLSGDALPTSFSGSNLTIYYPPQITSQPSDRTVTEGNGTNFSINTSGQGLSYQWQMSQDQGISWENLSNGGHYGNVTTRTLNLYNVEMAMEGLRYRCVVNGTCEPSVISDYATLHVTGFVPTIVTTVGSLNTCSETEFGIPVSVTNCNNVGAISLAFSYNTDVLTFAGYTGLNPALNSGQLQVNAANGLVFITWASITGADLGNGNLITINFTALSGVSPMSWNTSYCEYANPQGVVLPTSYNNGNVTVGDLSFTITQQPSNQTVTMEESTTFSIATTGPTSGFQWQESQDGGASWSNVSSGAHYANPSTNTLSVNNVTLEMNSYRYRCVVSGSCGVQYSSVAILTVHLPVNYYEVAAWGEPSEGGTVTGYGAYPSGETCTVTATPATGYDFINWTQDGTEVSQEASYTFIVEDDVELVAHFALQELSIVVEIIPEGSGTVNGAGTYLYGDYVLLTALPATGFVFDNWTENGNVVSVNQSISFTAQTDRNLVANFSVQQLTITAIAEPAGNGSVVGAGTYPYGSDVTLTATAAEGFGFDNWTENDTLVSTEPTLTFTAIEDRSLVAHFSILQISIEAEVEPAQSGSVAGVGIYNYGDPVVLTATSAPFFEFLNWTEDGEEVSTEATYSFTAQENRNLVAHFFRTVTILVDIVPEGSGSVNGAGNYNYGETVTLTATPNTSYNFVNWTENDTVVSTEATLSFTAMENRSLTANFEVIMYHVGVQANIEAAGTVSGGGDYQQGTQVTVSAIPNLGFEFIRWTENGASVSTNANYTFNVWAPRNLVAEFEMQFTDTTAYACESFTWHGHTYYSSNYYFDTLTSSVGLDSIVALHLIIWPSFHTELYETACESYYWEEELYTESGDYVREFQTVHGCDSILTLHLSILSDMPLGNFTYMSPANNYIDRYTDMDFYWDAILNASSYDFYFWQGDGSRPETPTLANTTSHTYHVNNLTHGSNYHWCVVAKNQCEEIESEVRSFTCQLNPSMTVVPKGLFDFGEVEVGQTNTKTISVSGTALTENISYTFLDNAWGNDAEFFQITPYNWNYTTGGLLHVTFVPVPTQLYYNAAIRIASGAFVDTLYFTGAMANRYVFTTEVEGEVYSANDDIVINGHVEDVLGNPVADMNVNVYLLVMGTRFNLPAVSDANGNYSVTYTPRYSESGYYQVGSSAGNEYSSAVHDSFDIPGMSRVSSDFIIWEPYQDETLNGTIEIRNRSRIPISNISVNTVSLPNGCVVSFSGTTSLGPLETGQLNYTVTGTQVTPGSSYEEANFTVTADNGITMNMTGYYYCRQRRGALDVYPPSIATSMKRYNQKVLSFQVTNNGNGETGPITVGLPDVEWMSVMGGNTMESLAVGDSCAFSVMLAPDENVDLVQYRGSIAVNCANGNGISIPYVIEATSDSTGVLMVDVTDDYTYNTNGGNGPHLAGAEVYLKGYYSLETIALGVTDEDGLFVVENVPEGYYYLTIHATQHKGYEAGIIYIEGGKTNHQNIYLQYQAISYSWVVVPTEVVDEYEFELVAEIKTNVPAPVITVDCPSKIDTLAYGDTIQFNMMITNHGLIDAYDTQLTMPSEFSEYDFYPMYDVIDTLHAQSAVIVPCIVTRTQRRDSNSDACKQGNGRTISFYWCNAKREWVHYSFTIRLRARCPENSGGGSTPPANPYISPYAWGSMTWPTGTSGTAGGTYVPRPSSGTDGGTTPHNGTDEVSTTPQDCTPCWKVLASGIIHLATDWTGVPISSLCDFGLYWHENVNYYKNIVQNVKSSPTSIVTQVGTDAIAVKDCIEATATLASIPNHYGYVINNQMNLVPHGWDYNLMKAQYAFQEKSASLSGAVSSLSSIVSVLSRLGECISFTGRSAYEIGVVMDQLDQSVNYYQSAFDEITNLFHDDEWLEEENIDNFVSNFQAVVDTTSYIVSSQSAQYLKDVCSLTHVNDSIIQRFVDRWNRSVQYWDEDIYTLADLPEGYNDDFIQLDSLMIAPAVESDESAIAYGFDNTAYMYYSALGDLYDASQEHTTDVCAKISVSFKQTMTMTREAFEGTLKIFNGHTTDPMQDINVDIVIKDYQGVDRTDLFQINVNSLTDITGVDGTGTLEAQTEGIAQFMMIPTIEAAPDTTKIYSFGGSFSFIDPFSGTEMTYDLFPVKLKVNPGPNLHVDYFISRHIISDDPLTDTVEATEPAELAMMISNVGAGNANNVYLESSQPQIIDNQSGLLISFDLVGAAMNGVPRPLGLTDIPFGTIESHSAGIAEWYFTSTLMARVIHSTPHVIHNNSYGNPNLSLVTELNSHELIKAITAYGSLDDGINDFFVNETVDFNHTPDKIYFSNGGTADVNKVLVANTEGVLSNENSIVLLNVNPIAVGWNYACIDDPGQGLYELISCTRDDGQVIPLSNVWISHVTMFDDDAPVHENKLHIVDTMAVSRTTTYTLVYANELYANITVAVNPPNSGNVSGAGVYDLGAEVVLEATPNMGYVFVSWIETDTVYSTEASISFIAAADRQFMANFIPLSYEIVASADPIDGGMVTGSGTYNHSETCTLTATANEGYHFVNWTKDGLEVCNDSVYAFVVTEDADFVAHFSEESAIYSITALALPTEGGTVSGGGTFTLGATCNLTAVPNAGYSFVNWTKDGMTVSTSATYSFTVAEDAIYVANFLQDIVYYEIAVSANPTAGGTVTGANTYSQGTTVTLTATANTGYHFVSWTLDGEEVSAEPSYSFEVDGSSDYVANFELNSYDITATANPEAGGTVDGAGEYYHFSTCTLTATNNVGYHFMNWTLDGEVVSAEPSYSFEVAGSADYVANFELNSYEITAVANPTEGGTVDGAGVYYHFSTCTLSATPNTGYHFVSWTLDGEVVSAEPSYSFEVAGSADYVANFELNSYEITAVANPTEGGTVDGAGVYYHFSTCTLSATPNTGYHFVSWTLDGEVVSAEPIYSFEVAGPADYVANFELNSYEITAVANPTEGGTVDGAGVYYHFSTCTLTATNNVGYHFMNWTLDGEVVSAEPSYSFEVAGSADYVANFELNSYEITAVANPTEGGTVDGAGVYYHFSTCTLSATSNTGYHFVSWTLDGEVVSIEPSYSFEVDGTADYVANFELNSYDITAVANPEAGGTVDGAGVYYHFSTCTLSATANTGYHFVSWTLDGEVVSIEPSYSFEVDGTADYVANFELNSYDITAVANPEAGGTVDGAGEYYHFSACTLTATSNTGYHFVSWTLDGEVVSAEPSYSFEVDGTADYVANFELNSYDITAVANPEAGGTVDGAGEYYHFSTCTLTATANTGYHFVSWTLDGEVVSIEPSYSFEVDGPADYVANFELNSYDITAVANPEAGGTVDGAGEYYHFSACTLTATANTGYHFVSWTLDGEVVSAEPSYSFEVDGTADYVANFELNSYDITAVANPEAGGTVDGAGEYYHFSTCTLTATANTGYHFVSWTLDGEVVSIEPSYSFEVDGPADYVANFELNSYDIVATAMPTNGGTVNGAGIYNHSEICTLTAASNVGYHFVNWVQNGTVVSTVETYSFTVTEASNFVANFALNIYSITASVNPIEGGTVTGGGNYLHGAMATLTAVSNTGYTFINWTKNGEVVSTEANYSFTVTEAGDYVAHFELTDITQSSDFVQGWNWWSSYVELDGANSLQTLQNGLGTNGMIIKSQNDGYASYLAGFGWYGSLTTINNLSTYQVKANAACTVEMTGNATNPADYPITLNNGWTWVGYPVTVSMGVSEAFSGIAPQSSDILKSQNDGFASYLEGFGWYGSLNTLHPGMGLMFKSNNNEDIILIYPDGGPRTDLKANQTTESNHWQPDLNAYPDNMSVMAVVELDGNELEGENFELAAFANGEVRGSAKLLYVAPIDRFIAFLTVAGDEAAELRFGLYDAETGEVCLDSDNAITYETNAVIGSFAEPYVVSFRGTTGVDEWANSLNVYPNPVWRGQTITLGFNDMETSEMRVEIINPIGAVVETVKASSAQTITAPETAGVYTLRITVEGKGTCYRKLVVR